MQKYTLKMHRGSTATETGSGSWCGSPEVKSVTLLQSKGKAALGYNRNIISTVQKNFCPNLETPMCQPCPVLDSRF